MAQQWFTSNQERQLVSLRGNGLIQEPRARDIRPDRIGHRQELRHRLAAELPMEQITVEHSADVFECMAALAAADIGFTVKGRTITYGRSLADSHQLSREVPS